MTIKIFVFLMAAVIVFGGGKAAFAQRPVPFDALIQEGSHYGFGVSNVGILPSSPFYFIKNWRRGLRRLFTREPVNRARLNLRVLNEKAAEIKVILVSQVSSTVLAALPVYQKDLEKLARLRQSLTESPEKSARVYEFLDELANNLLKHEEFLDELQAEFKGDAAAANNLVETQKTVFKALAGISAFSDPANFKARLKRAIKNQWWVSDGFREFRGAESLNRLDEYLDERFRPPASELSDELLTEFIQGVAARYQYENLKEALFERLAGDRETRLEILDEARDKAADQNFKNMLNLVRQDLLAKLENEGLSEERAKAAISRAEKIITELKSKISSGEYSVSNSAKDLTKQAEFKLDQARQFLKENNFDGAFGQASAAQATGRNALRRLTAGSRDFQEELFKLKARFDQAVNKKRFPEKTKELENAIINFSQLVDKLAGNKADLDKVNAELERIERLLSELENPPVGSRTLAPAASSVPLPVKISPEAKTKPRPSITARTEKPLSSQNWTVTMNGGQFQPSYLRIKKGESVTWKNMDTAASWPASDLHPVHALYPGSGIGKCGTAEQAKIFDSCKGLATAKAGQAAGATFTFVFNNVGAWAYHDHLKPAATGIIEVVN